MHSKLGGPGDTNLILYPYSMSLMDSRGLTVGLCLLLDLKHFPKAGVLTTRSPAHGILGGEA